MFWLGLACFAGSVSAADFTVYWSADGVAPTQVQALAGQFQTALQRELGIDAEVIVADAAQVSQAAKRQQLDMLITCNEVSSTYGVPLERLSSQAAQGLSCIGGHNTTAWTLAMDQDIKRRSSGEFWVYFMRDSAHFARLRDVRAALPQIRKSLPLDTLTTAVLVPQ
ncbi:MAG: hypothetical protein CSA54_02600 [Gammaproteobacteria bacterium]|nr:MAG: hypothetical protein CSA54_02600 [Gammaproteobacteria bacterium]